MYKKKYDYSKGKKCPDCGNAITNKARRCKSCARKLSVEEETPSCHMAWQYPCSCGHIAHSFEPHLMVQATCGHDVTRVKRTLYLNSRFHNPCPVCDREATAHSYQRDDESGFCRALCPGIHSRKKVPTRRRQLKRAA